MRGFAAALIFGCAACSAPVVMPMPAVDGGVGDAAMSPMTDAAMAPVADASMPGIDAGVACSVGGVAGTCMWVAECAALGETSTAGHCPGPANFECCTMTPSVSSNPPTPTGWKPMMDSEVTQAMTTWAVDILHDTVDYPMFSTAMMTFGALDVLARVEWHPPDFQNGVVHRGVTLYEPL